MTTTGGYAATDSRFRFAQVDFDYWTMLAQTPGVPKWQQLAFLAYSRMGRNGHSRFDPGELSSLLSPGVRLNTDTGEMFPERDDQMRRVIRTAVTKGWLLDGSEQECLVVPNGINMGNNVLGRWSPCPVHRGSSEVERG